MTSRIATANREILMPGMRAIIKYISENEEVTRTKLYFNLDYSAKYIQACLRRLSISNMIDTVPNLEDMRKVFYVLIDSK